MDPSILGFSSNSSGSTSLFRPTDSQIGIATLSVVLSDSYDTTTCDWPVKVMKACTIDSSSPSSALVKVPRLVSTTTVFGVTANDSSCAVEWTLNGTIMGSNNFLNLDSLNSALNQETNTLVATVSSGYGVPSTRTWVVKKNNLPTCPSQIPANPVTQTNYPANMNFTANGLDIDYDALTFIWKLNGLVNATNLFSYNNLPTSSQAQFAPGIEHVGNNGVIAEISDGYDISTCSWSVAVTGDCSLVSSTPASAMVRAFSTDVTQNIFQTSTSTPGCSVQWRALTYN
jgi:hypothetical protein